MDNNFKKKINKALLGAATSMSVLSGCAVNADVNNKQEVVMDIDFSINPDETVEIDDVYKDDLSKATGNDINHDYTYAELAEIKSLYLHVDSEASLDWLNNCLNLTDLRLNWYSDDKIIDRLNEIKKLPNLTSLDLFDSEYYEKGFYEKHKCYFISEDDLAFVDKSKLTSINLFGAFILDKNFLYGLENLENLKLDGDSIVNFDAERILGLNELKEVLVPTSDNDMAIYVDKDYCKRMTSQGIDIHGLGENNEFDRVNTTLNAMVDNLKLDSNMSEREKMANILLCVIGHYEIYKSLDNRSNPNQTIEEYAQKHTCTTDKPFGGYLYGMFSYAKRYDGYATLVSALAKRAGLNDCFLKSNNYSWNLVELDGEYYYIDPAILTAYSYFYGFDIAGQCIEAFKAGNVLDFGQLNWCMKYDQVNQEIDNLHNIDTEIVDNIIMDIEANKQIIANKKSKELPFRVEKVLEEELNYAVNNRKR